MACAICETRRPRRYCPGVRGDICSWCCGNEREVTVDCPFDCEYLHEARKHEKRPEIDVAAIPNRDIQPGKNFLRDHNEVFAYVCTHIVSTAEETPGLIDFDLRDALESLIRTYRTLQSGVYYESRPVNPLAARIYDAVQEALSEFRKAEVEQLGMTRTRDSDILGVLVIIQRFELDQNNGRRRGRAFLHGLHSLYSPLPEPEDAPPSSLILP
jgi:hypothetical protein